MKNNEKWFEHIFNNSGVGILIVDKNRKILELNQTFCNMLGYKYEELINQHAKILHTSDESSEKFGEIAFDTVLTSNSLDLEYKFKHKNNYPIWIKITGDVIKNNQEVLWIATNINKKVKFQEELANLNDTLSNKIENQVKILREKD